MKKLLTYYGSINKSISQLIICVMFMSVALQSNAQISVKLNFSQERGFSDAAFNLTITSTENDAIIRYTLDGEEPTTNSGVVYNGSLTIDTTTVLRAIGYIQGVDTSKIYTHTYLFIDDVIQQPANIDGWPNNTYDIGSGNGTAVHDYEMDPSIVNSSDYNADLIKGLKDIPSMSIVMPKDDFLDMYDGTSEKKTSIELLYDDDPGKNEQEDCGIEPHSHDRLKRSMRLSFKQEYGTANWDSDIFRNAAVGSETAENEFDRIVLRAGNNRAWSRNWNPDRTAFTRDEWFRQSQIASSGIGSHGTFVHLYVNGIYWGLYNPVERPDEAFTSNYLGGEKEDWFAISHGGNQGGSSARYDYMMDDLLNTDLTQSSNYDELKSYLDIDKFSDYLLVSWMTGVQDWPNNNWWGGNRNNPAGPFMYFGWDNEWSWDVTNNANNGAWVHPQFESNDTGGNASAFVFNKSKVNEDFKMAFADRAYKLCFNNGAMTDDNSRLRWSTLNDDIKDAVVAESARWGDGIDDGVTRTRDVHWQDEVDRLDALMDGNVDRLIIALRDEDYYPLTNPPLLENNTTAIEVQEFSVNAGYTIDLVNPNSNGDIYYSTNGIDPRMSGGAIDPSAIVYSNQDLIIDNSTNLLARIKIGNEWSALRCLNVIVNVDLSWIKLTEIMYNPLDFGLIESAELEFLEIKNTSTSLTLDISGLQIANGVDFTFPVGTTMDPQSFLVVASNEIELSAKCPDISIFGEYAGALSNGGELIEFVTFVGDTIISVDYDDKSPWPTEADGDGYSLVPSIANPVGSQDDFSLWKLSADNFCGSPLADDEYDCLDSDEDDDGVCDDDDQCPGFDDSLVGTSCDDGNPCTTNDVYTSTCECAGTIEDDINEVILSAIDDAYLQGASGFNSDILRIEANNRVSYLKFNVPVPNGTLVSADLELQVSNDPGDGQILVFSGSSNNWTETNLSTTNSPAEVIQIANLDTTYSAEQSYSWSLNPSQITSGDLSLILRQIGGNDVSFHSDEATNITVRPLLTLTYSVSGGSSTSGTVCDDDDPCTVNDILDNNCNCAGTFADADNDGICDADDQCADFDDSLIGTSCDDGDASTTEDVYTDNCVCQGTLVSTNTLLEAENASVGSNWTIVSDTEACGSEYALPPNTTQFNEAPSLAEDHITFTFNVDVAGTYKVYARTLTTSGDDDSFWVRANGDVWYPWNKINFGNYGNFYQWSQLGNWTSGDNATPLTFELVAGVNTVNFAWREPGARLDKIFVTNEDLSVLNLVRNNDSSGELSFKYTVEEACPNDTIRFESITDGTPIIVDNDMITIDRKLTIIGNGSAHTVLSGDELYQIFMNTSSSLSIHNLKMENGFAPSDGGAFINNGVMLLKDIELEGNMEGATPKAFSNNGTVNISENSNVIIKE